MNAKLAFAAGLGIGIVLSVVVLPRLQAWAAGEVVSIKPGV